nr:tyrosine-type recombinase/integrase [Nostoc sp. LEGE 06077]
MCLHPEEIPPIPDETVRVAKAAFAKGNLYMRLRDELGVFYQDEDFASLYPQRGQPAQAPWRLAMIRTALTQMSSAGIPLRTIQEISGHSDLGTLQRYLEVTPEQKRKAVSVIWF